MALESRAAIELLADKWRITIIHLLRNGALRNHQLQSAMEVSPKMLTQTLRRMERDGLLSRIVYPSRVQYELTAMGLSVIHPIQALCKWAKAHSMLRDAARARFDLAQRMARTPRRR